MIMHKFSNYLRQSVTTLFGACYTYKPLQGEKDETT